MRKVFTDNFGNGDSWMLECESSDEAEEVMDFLLKGIEKTSMVDVKQTDVVKEKGKKDVGKSEEGS